MNWIKVKDKLPADGTDNLLLIGEEWYINKEDGRQYRDTILPVVGRYLDNKFEYYSERYDRYEDITDRVTEYVIIDRNRTVSINADDLLGEIEKIIFNGGYKGVVFNLSYGNLTISFYDMENRPLSLPTNMNILIDHYKTGDLEQYLADEIILYKQKA